MIFRRLETRYSEVLRVWEGRTVAVIGCGPSLTREQVGMVRDADIPTIAVNDSFLWADFADVSFAADSHWHAWMQLGYSCKPNGDRIPLDKPKLGLAASEVKRRWAEFGGEKATIQGSGGNVADDRVHMLKNRDIRRHTLGWSTDPQILVTGYNSGFQAMNIAGLAGAKRILLVGFDGTPGHFHGGHPRITPEGAYPQQRLAMNEAKAGVKAQGIEVLNCTPCSAIDAWPKVNLADALS